MIEIIGPALNQWDVGRSVKLTNIEADCFHFANKGDLKAVIMNISEAQSKIPDYLLQTGKPICVYAVKGGVTVESTTFFVRKRERPEEYVYEDDDRNYIYELLTEAKQAIENANTAAQRANDAADKAEDAQFVIPYIGDNGNWWTGDTDTGVKAQGEKGDPGEQGPQGEQGIPGEPGKDGHTPVKGVDYFTEEDKEEMVEAVLAALPSAEGVGF